MNNQPIIDAFERFSGPEKFREFIDAACGICAQKGRLMFWQESLWRDFSKHTPDAPQNSDDILAIFRYCPVHSLALQQAETTAPIDQIRQTPEYEAACQKQFPFSTTQLRCTGCEKSRSGWITAHPDLCRILQRQTTCAEYYQRAFGDTEIDEHMQTNLSKRTAEIESEMQPGDELWEWNTGGWHNLAGRSGLAIVRAGEIVNKWCELKS